MTQEHAFTAAELSLQAQALADTLVSQTKQIPLNAHPGYLLRGCDNVLQVLRTDDAYHHTAPAPQ